MLAISNLEHRAGFEPAALGICSPLHWATLPPVRCWASPFSRRTARGLSYVRLRFRSALKLAPVHGFEPRLVVLETIVLAVNTTPESCYKIIALIRSGSMGLSSTNRSPCFNTWSFDSGSCSVSKIIVR
jgi:hypothetical protein